MPTVANPYSYASPIADAVTNLRKMLLTSGADQGRNIYNAEQALKLKNEREGRAGVASAFANFGQPGFDRNAAMHDAVIGDYNPAELAALERYGAANTYGATDARTTNAFVGAGGAYGSTAAGFREGEANENARNAARIAENARQFDFKPFNAVGADGNPVIMTNKTAVGMAPVLSDSESKATMATKNWSNLDALTPAQKAYIGAAGSTGAKTPRNYVAQGKNYITYDGITDVNGNPLPPGGAIVSPQGSAEDVGLTNAVKSKVQGEDLATQELGKILDYTENLVTKNPSSVGAAGVVKGVVQDVSQIAGNLAAGLGFKSANDAIAAVKANATKQGVSPAIIDSLFNFDPSVPGLSTAYGLLVYSAAQALAGQQGRGVSDQDVKKMQAIVGDPRGMFENQTSLLTRLGLLRDFMNIKRGVINGALGKEAPAGEGAAPPKVIKWGRDANGNPVPVQ